MSADEDTYPQHARSKVHRYGERGRYDYATIHGILQRSPVWNVAFSPSRDDPFPTILPMIGCVGLFTDQNASTEDAPMDLYLHGAAAARLLKIASETHSQSSCDDADEDGEAAGLGFPLAISATLIDGFVLALTPMHHSMNYRSAVVHGYAMLVTSSEERLWAMHRITNAIVPQRWENSRIPPTKSELNQTGILRVKIVSASAKVRSGGPGEDRRDAKDPEVRDKVWTGVVPSWIQYGEPVPAEDNVLEDLPAYIGDWAEKTNANAKALAERAVDR